MTTRLSFLLLIAVLFVITLAGTHDAFSTSVSVARQHEAGEISTKYYELSALPVKETKAWFRNASPNEKSELWRTHLALFLVTHPELNERQKKVVLAGMSLVTPEFFEIRSSDPGWKAKVGEPLRALEEQITRAFSPRDAAKIFVTLSSHTESANCAAGYADSVLLKSVNYPFSQAPNRFGMPDVEFEKRDCGCSTDSDWCPISGYCKAGSCTRTTSGCGTFWNYPCDGMCR